MPHFTTTGYCNAWGSAKNARRVHGLTRAEKTLIQTGGLVILQGCPTVRGRTDRRIIERSGRYYARMI
jgi:hypothetical protein